MDASDLSVQERYAPRNQCFGCGPLNQQGLRIRSFERDDSLVATWTPQTHHEAFDNILNGGIIGSLLDCHSNWAAALRLMRDRQLDVPPCTVTASYSVRLQRPTPTDGPIELKARVVESDGTLARVEAELSARGKVCATCRGKFVAVEPGHPAYHRW